MIHLLTIIGARPQIIKAAAFSRAVAAWNSTHAQDKQIHETFLHTGQHYDDNMSDIFFRELGLHSPDIHLHVGSASQAEQTAAMLTGIEKVLLDSVYNGVVLFGDTNSTLAGALAASKLNIPIFHIEAGLRSFNRAMPEEINRIVTDSVSSVLFTPTTNASRLLEAAGTDEKRIYYRRYYVQVGDIMFDNALFYSQIAEQQSHILSDLNLQDTPYVLATVHRPANTDNSFSMQNTIAALETISKKTEVVFPLHPRTRSKMSEDLLARLNRNSHIRLIEPVSYLDMIQLEKHATLILTDSGGVQKEAFFFGKPCVILRAETEWYEIVDAGAAITTFATKESILSAYRKLLKAQVVPPTTLYGDGHAAERMVQEIVRFLLHDDFII